MNRCSNLKRGIVLSSDFSDDGANLGQTIENFISSSESLEQVLILML